MGDLREQDGGITEERPVLSPTSSSNLSPSAELWDRAEQATQKIICRVQPTAVSEERRKEVVDYIQRLLKGCLGCEVYPFGSVPLKTYLPDGDIDLTAFGGASVEDALANDVVSVLEGEDQNRAAEFVVKDVQLIRAEVKIVKCIVQNIVVDISFNQLGGLCTLCFLEQVDHLIGGDHLFKRSIILIKAWCYYESRILGAHHGLISTYALETLVLYIFHLFHSTLNGPLAVLYKFLDYFSKFDWDNYCISLTGPVRISSLPEIVAEIPENGGSDLLLSNDFIRYCMDMFSVPSRGVDINSRAFPPKHLNIVDPLKENNNLGRSVSKGNFYRIRSAFMYGARKLGRVLLQPDDNIADELRKFFSNTLDRHGSGQRPDVQGPFPLSSPYGFGHALRFTETESCDDENGISESKPANLTAIPDRSFHDGDYHTKVSGMGMEISRTANGHVNELQKGSTNVDQLTVLSETDGSANGTAVLAYRSSGDAQDLATSRLQGLKISNGSPKFSPPSIEDGVSPPGIVYHAPHLYFSGSVSGNGTMRHGNSDLKEHEGTGIIDHCPDKNQSVGNHKVPTSPSEDLTPGYRERTSADSSSLSDLSGDYDNYLKSLHYGRSCFDYALTFSAFPVPPPLPSPFTSKNSWDGVLHPSQFKRNGFSLTNRNGVLPRQVYYPMNTLVIPGGAFCLEDMPKPRGTGTYFPNTNRPPYQKPSTPRGRNQNQPPVRSPRNNNRPVTLVPVEANLLERSSRELSQAQFPVDQDCAKPGFSETYQSSPQSVSRVNGFALQSESVVEFGSVGRVPLPAPSVNQTSSQSLPTPAMQRPIPILGMNPNRVMVQSSYHLQDEEDFPRLAV